MECQRIRVLLDLSELKDRLHKYVWMHISTSDLKSIADFKDAVVKKLAFDRIAKDIKLFINGGLLLDEENILVLRENDTVQIQCENISTDHSKSFIEVQDTQISGVRLSSELSHDNLSKAEVRSKKKKRLSEVVVIDSPNSCKEEYLHKRKREDLVSNNSSENHDSIYFPQEESVMTFCKIDKSTNNQKKRKKSCSSSTPKEDLIENELNNGKGKEKSDTRIWEEYTPYESKKKKQTQFTSTSFQKDALIQIEEDNTNLIQTESPFVASENKSTTEEKERKSYNSVSSDSFIKNQHSEDNEGISIIPVEISLEDSSQEIDNDQSIAVVEPFVQSNNCKKKKRRRHRKRKTEHNLVSHFMPENICTLPQPVKDPPSAFEKFVGVRQHIRFTSPEADSKKNTDTLNLVNSFHHCASPIETGGMTINETGRNYATPVANVSSSSMNQDSSYKSFDLSSTVSPSKCNYLNELSLKNPVSTRREPESTRKEFEPARNSTVHSSKDYPPLNALPCIETCIAFKLLELNENYSPEISSYKEGVIKSINTKTDEIEIELTKVEIKPGKSGKFENLKEGELPDVEVTNKVITCWSSLIEPRLVSRQ